MHHLGNNKKKCNDMFDTNIIIECKFCFHSQELLQTFSSPCISKNDCGHSFLFHEYFCCADRKRLGLLKGIFFSAFSAAETRNKNE